MRAHLARTTLLSLAIALVLPGCRKSDGLSVAVFSVSTAGASGCSGPDAVFVPCDPGNPPCFPPTDVSTAVLTTMLGVLYSQSQVTASGTGEILYVTGLGGTVVEIDFSGGPPVEREVLTVAGGAVAALLTGFGIVAAPTLSGIAVLDGTTLIVMEHTANILLAVDLTGTDLVVLFAGDPNTTGAFVDGLALGPGAGRFDLQSAAQIAPLGDGAVLVADSGNHAIRRVVQNFPSAGFSAILTLTGTGTAFFSDGSLESARFDSPTGLTLQCNGQLLITETGGAMLGGHRLRQVVLGVSSPFELAGTVFTRAGDGTSATAAGDGEMASLDAPVSPLATSASDVYLLDSTLGILRRMSGPDDTLDCPLWIDCATAVAQGGNFSDAASGGTLSMTQTPAGVLYVLDTFAAVLYQVAP